MVIYKCDRCGKSYYKKYDYNRHINRKNQCKISAPICTELHQKTPIEKELVDTNKHTVIAPNELLTKTINIIDDKKLFEKEYKCNYCNKQFSRYYSLNRHISLRCKIKMDQDNQKEQIFQKLLNEMMELKQEISQLKKSNKNINKGTINNSVDNSNNINNNVINIQLVAYGKEDYDKLTEKEYKIIINKGFKSIQEAVKSLHFNKNRPENHNIYISNIRDNYVMIYDGNKWELRNRKETIEELFIAKKDILVDKFDEK